MRNEGIYSLPQIASILQKEKHVVFTSGVYDLFHIGHLETLRQSAQLANKLIVGVNSDRLVRKYKRQPIFNQQQRLHIVANLDFVDFVVPIDHEDSVDHDYFMLKAFLMLRPNVVTFGMNSDFKGKIAEGCRLVEAESVEINHAYNDKTTSSYIEQVAREYYTQTGNAYVS